VEESGGNMADVRLSKKEEKSGKQAMQKKQTSRAP
jgi:hypothetical protein